MAATPENRVANGGFEQGESGWLWQQWKGKSLPGRVDREDAHEGRASFKLHQPDAGGALHIAKQVQIEPGRNYVLSLALKTDGMPDGAARVRLLVDGERWYAEPHRRVDVVTSGGTHGWKTYTVPIRASLLRDAEKLTIFIIDDKPAQGTLGIDAVSMTPAALSVSARGNLDSVSYSTATPVVLAPQHNAVVAIGASPDRALYRTGALPKVTVTNVATPGATLAYRVIDGFGNVLVERSSPAERAQTVEVRLPPGHGYYEVIASLSRDGEDLGEARRSIGALPPPAKPTGDEPFGLWIQGEEYYPELGVRWVRDGLSWDAYKRRGNAYLDARIKFYEWCHANHIRVLAFPKGHPRRYQTSREVIEDTPDAWRAEEEWWTTMVRRLADQVDAWGVVNEPMRGQWKGSNALIMRYWALMRRIVDRYDPEAPLIGPSLSPNTPAFVEQYRELLNMGFGKYIDAIEMHTYINNPDRTDWAGNTQRILDMTRRIAGRDLPIWSTEHGFGGTYRNELRQAQLLMRAWLEAKKIGYPVMIWHMFSYPQGNDTREKQFGIFRNVKQRGGALPQPRPAGVAYGVMTRQLAGASYKTQLDYLGPSVHAYVFERDGKAMAALWTTSRTSHEVTLSAGDEKNITVTGLFGRVEPLQVRDGVVRVTVDRNPKFVAPLPAFYLRREPIARLDKPIEALPGKSDQATLTLVNPTQDTARLRIEWLPSNLWQLTLPRHEWSLGPKQSLRVPLTATAPPGLAIGPYQVHGKIFLNWRYVTSLDAQATVLPQATVADIEPRFEGGRPVVAGTLRRLDPALDAATLQLADGRSAALPVTFGNRNRVSFVLPVKNPAPARLEDFTLVVYGAQGKVQSRQNLRLSFVPTAHVDRPPRIDGDLTDWPTGGTDDGLSVRWAWDERHLYLAVRVPDPKHVQTQPVDRMWKEDSLQIGIAPDRMTELVREYMPGLQEAEMVEFDVALRGDGPAMYRHRTVNKQLAPVGEVRQEQIRYAVRSEEGLTSYELQIPVKQLGLKPLRAGEVLRAGLLINANDGRGRRTREWFGGIMTAKDPDLFGHLILRE